MTQQQPDVRLTLQHEIDEDARRRIPIVFPRGWICREPTGRDYGIDMHVEVFDAGVHTGRLLLLQNKGTEMSLPTDGPIPHDVPVATLRYAELFAVPFILMVCPVNQTPIRGHYLWLQEYISVVLNHEVPDWRSYSSTVRVHIPAKNVMPGREDHLRFIANHPQRQHGWTQAARYYRHILESAVPSLTPGQEGEAYARIRQLLIEIRELPGIFGDPTWKWAQEMRRNVIDLGIRAAELLINDGPVDRQEAERLCPQGCWPGDDGRNALVSRIWETCPQLLEALADGNDDRVKRQRWLEHGEHEF